MKDLSKTNRIKSDRNKKQAGGKDVGKQVVVVGLRGGD